MNETKHTPTPPPLVIRESGLEIHIDAPCGDPNLSAPYKWSAMAVFYGDENRPEKGRQVALSNARMFVEAHEVRRQRDKLLEALEELEKQTSTHTSKPVGALQKARAAITKAKGETNTTKQ